MNADDTAREPTRAEVDALPGPVVLEFGAGWCGYCSTLRPHVRKIMADFPEVRHVPIEDGQGQPLGRSFRVKLWPTFIFMRDGKVLGQAVRPSPAEVRKGFERIVSKNKETADER